MARTPKPWWWEDRECYYVTLWGRKTRLDPNLKTARSILRQMQEKGRPDDEQPADSAVAVIDQFLGWCSANRPDSYDWYFKFLNPFCKTIADLAVDELENHHVTAFIGKDTWGAGGKRAAVTAIKRAFNWAVKEGKIRSNPVKHAEKPEAPVREQIVTREVHDKAVALTNPAFADLLELAWETGARPFELYLLEKRHLEGNRAVYPVKESKGKKKKRVIYFSPKAQEIINRNMRDGVILRNNDGNPWTIYSISSVFARLAGPKKLNKRYCLYNWRHTFAHRKLTEGMDSMVLATLMGHSSTAMLEKVYAHIHKNADFLLAQLAK